LPPFGGFFVSGNRKQKEEKMATKTQYVCDKCGTNIDSDSGFIELQIQAMNLNVLKQDVCKPCLLKILKIEPETRTKYIYASSDKHGGPTGPMPPPELENNSDSSFEPLRGPAVAAKLANLR
jgi:DNA-directed RNA polymerase subunit RPC12/RpoP